MLKPVDLSGGKSVLRSVLNIFVSQSTGKTSSIGVSFFFFSKVQDCQCNMGKFEGNSLIGKNSYSIKGTQSNLGFCSIFGLSIPVEYGC